MADAGATAALAGQVALVTGGSGGIGRAVVHRLAAAGASVAVGYGHTRYAAERTAADIAAAGGTAIAVGADLSHPDAPGELVSAVEHTLGPVTVLVSNAGLAGGSRWRRSPRLTSTR